MVCVTGLLAFSVVSCVLGPSNPGMYLGSKRDDCGLAVGPTIGKSLRWNRDNLPVSFHVHESVPVPAHKNFISALENWNLAWEAHLSEKGVEPFPLFHVENPRAQYSGAPANDSHNMIFFLDNYNKYKKETEQAVTGLFYDTNGKLNDADILVNNTGEFKFFYDEAYNRDVFAFKQRTSAQRGLASSRAPGFFNRLSVRILARFAFFFNLFKQSEPLRKIARTPDRIPADSVDFPSLMIHEVKHVVSGQHCKKNHRGRCVPEDETFQKDKAYDAWVATGQSYYSVMEPILTNGRIRRDITLHDLEKLFCGYIGL